MNVTSSLGVKRYCVPCQRPFYDLQKSPVVCPTCQQTYTPPTQGTSYANPSPHDYQGHDPAYEASEFDHDMLEDVLPPGTVWQQDDRIPPTLEDSEELL